MGIPRWGLVLGSIALLLDPTFADVLVQQGYDQQSNQRVAERSPTATQAQNPQPIVQPNQNYVSQQNPVKQILEYQHKIQQQQLQSIHQQERDQLLQMQHQQLQHPMVQQSQVPRNDIVGTPLGFLPHHHSLIPAMGGFKGGRLFSLGPLGLNSFSIRGLGGMTPLLLSPYQPQQITGSNQFEKSSVDESKDGNRKKRQVRDGGEPNGRKWRQKVNSRTEQNGMAEDQALMNNKKSNPNSQIVVQPRKSNENVAGSPKNNDEDTVGSRSLLDPLGLADKAEDLIENLKHGQLPNPLDMLNGGGPASHPSWLNKESPGGSQKFEEHLVSQPNQRYQQPNYGMQSPEPITGGAWKYPYDSPPLRMPTNPRMLGQSNPFPTMPQEMYRMPQPTMGQPWNGRSNSNNNGMMASDGYRETQWPQAPQNPNSYNQPALTQQRKSQTTTGWTNGEVDQLTGGSNPKTQPENKSLQDQSASGNPIQGKDSITGTSNGNSQIPNLQSTANSWSGDSNHYRQMLGGPNPMGKTGQPVMGTLYDPITGNARPAAWNGYQQTLGAPSPGSFGSGRMGRSDMTGSSLTDLLYGVGSQLMGYGNGNYPYDGYGMENGPGRRFSPNFDLDEMIDGGYGYNNFNNYGNGYDRPYGNGYGYDDGFYGSSMGGLYPQSHHHRPIHRPQFF